MAQNTYIPKNEIKLLSRRSDLMGWLLTLHCWAVIFASIALFFLWPNLLTFVLAVVIIGARQLGMSILMHDAAHGVLFKTQSINNFVGQYLLGHPVGADVHAYRRYHLVHHKNTQQDNDPDLVLSAPFPITRDSLHRKIVRDLTGQTGIKLRAAQLMAELRKIKSPLRSHDQAFNTNGIAGPYLINLLLFLVCFLSGYWWIYFAFWLLPLLTVFQLVVRVRNIAEHAMTSHDDNPLQHARTTKASLLARMFVAPYWVNYHVEHHAYMYVPCWRLKALHAAMEREGHLDNMETRHSYLEVLRLVAPVK